MKNPFARRAPTPEESAYARLARKGYSPATIVDVGAYEGNWTRLARRTFPAARAIMCEVQPGKRAGLEAVASELGRVKLVSAVLSARADETVRFNEMETGSSLYPENSNVERTERELVTTTLDIATQGAEGPAFLKIDVQGAELDVLTGGQDFLAKCDLVQLEIALLDYNRGAPRFVDVIGYMDERGFVPYDIAGWSRPNRIDLVQMDLLFTRRDSPLRTTFFEF
ncbi:FkbM family methyltransferase [Tsuneonella amylolytica]|uniref:FkbM family methyltransferase n=1 Tax=Tsuneonella amylolytica TaxID=2338327 RepID=UPI000EA94F18|nr:FkbM family methyltransferase [Tsuneonella amylolytica]